MLQNKNIPFLVLISFILISCGGGGGGGSGGDSDGSSTPPNRAPSISNSSLNIYVEENQTSAFTITATDPDSDSLSYSLSGSDGSLFSVSATGVVTFNTAPDFENPADADSNNSYELMARASDGSLSDSKNFTVVVTNDPSDDLVQNNPDFKANTPYYTSKPDSLSSDAAHRYYEYYWQSNPKVHINIYEPDLIEDAWETKIETLLNWAKDNLGLIVPFNAGIVDQNNAATSTLRQIDIDFCNLFDVPLYGAPLEDCVNNADSWGNRSAAAGVSHGGLPNGGDLFFFKNNWTDHTEGSGVPERILMHEFYHIYQNSMKFYFEDKNQFGIRIDWEDDEDSYLHEQDFVTVFPNWIEEGGAEFASIAMVTQAGINFPSKDRAINFLDEARNVISTAAANGDTVSLKDYEYQTGLYESSNNPNNGIAREKAYHYSGGSMAFIYLWSLDPANFKKIIVDYYTIYAERDNTNPGQGWKDSFEELFGITMEQFYIDFDAFMLQDRDSQIAIIKEDSEWENASWTNN